MIVPKMVFSDVFAANCYFYVDEKSKHGFVIDPSAHAEILARIVQERGWVIEKILLTHSHLDHVGAALQLSKLLNVDIFGMKAAEEYLLNPNLKGHFTDWNVIENMRYFNDGDEVVFRVNFNNFEILNCDLLSTHMSGHSFALSYAARIC